ncbi:MAG: hypothetical protein EXS13_03800 [Planctomycetes bacterium]|nr:hypothetical protein [Planctomycetota bacterium]
MARMLRRTRRLRAFATRRRTVAPIAEILKPVARPAVASAVAPVLTAITDIFGAILQIFTTARARRSALRRSTLRAARWRRVAAIVQRGEPFANLVAGEPLRLPLVDQVEQIGACLLAAATHTFLDLLAGAFRQPLRDPPARFARR